MQFKLNELRELISEALRKAYEILGVSPGASQDEIKQSYRKKAVELHPDRNPGKDTQADMVKLNVAYGLLSDPDKRRRYDAAGDKTLGDAGGFGYGPPPGPRPQSRPQSSWSPPPPRPSPGPSATRPGTASAKRYFVFDRGTSRKFWEVERKGNDVFVRFGRMGSQGQVKKHQFGDELRAIKFVRTKVGQKLDKGYREVQTPASASPPPPPKNPAPSASAPKPPPTPGVASKTYKIYGRKGKAPAHTRYQGRVYVAGADTKFKNGDQANVGVGTDGRLSVNDPKTNHTQNWYSESYEQLIDDMILDEMFGFPDDIENM